MRLALDLAAESGLDLPLSAHVGRIWEEARARLPDTADFTRMADYRTTEGES
ncbi:hypothetical protein [Methylobacterium oryzisoli]|uniref:hypothetical protein n=1 Tax=Methylobacterium oryzisoli TaxID=3385502 RepID=UPI00397B5A20